MRTPSAPSQTNNELTQIRESISTLGGTKTGPGFISIRYPHPLLFTQKKTKHLTHLRSWIAQLSTTFNENGLENVIVDRRKFAKPIATLLLDTWIMAAEEFAFNVLDKLGGGQGDAMRGFIQEVGRNRQNTCFNLDRVITVGQKPL